MTTPKKKVANAGKPTPGDSPGTANFRDLVICLTQVTPISCGCGIAAAAAAAGAAFDQLVARSRSDGDGLLDEPVEQFARMTGTTTVESKREFVEEVIQVSRAHSLLMCAEQPSLE
jgi:hypothetical protein